MNRRLVAVAAGAALATGVAAAHAGACTSPHASASYTSSVRRAVASNRDVWGDQLLRTGPSLASARKLLAPLTQGMQWEGKPLTAGGFYYLPFSFPFTTKGSTVFALHVADGSQIFTRRVDGPSLTIDVDGARYASCTARLAEGYLPMLETSDGARFSQESFVGRVNGRSGARSVISFVRLTVDTRRSTKPATIRLVSSKPLSSGSRRRLIVSRGAELTAKTATFRIPAGTRRNVYADWLHAPSAAPSLRANAATYRRARRTVVSFWRGKLGVDTFRVPEPAVQDAMRSVLTQLIAYGWRYSIGNAYEELSYQESLDAAEVAAELGYPKVARSILELALRRMRLRPFRFTAARGSHILSTAALYVRLTGDRDFLRAATPELAYLVDRISWRQNEGGGLLPEALSTDLENRAVSSVSGQIAAVQGLLAIARVWRSAGYSDHGATRLATSIDRALRPALARASARLADGSLFVPDQFPQKPFERLTATKDGSYWNLIMPAAFGSGWFPARSPTTAGILRYLLSHGSRALGLPRTDAHSVYGNRPGAGIAPVYQLGISRFLAAEDKPGLLDVGLYGMLAAGMTRGTYVSGEAVSLVPIAGAFNRAMFMPPNTGTNASFLGTLRELLVHERKDGLDLAFSTPKAWLADGKTIAVRNAPTSFGKVSYSLTRRGSEITARLVLPPGCGCRLRLRTAERIERVSTGVLHRDGTIDLRGHDGAFDLHAGLRP